MNGTMLLALLVCLGTAPVYVETWTGYLVDSKCYASQERNVNPFDPTFNTNHDRGYEIRVCQPNAKTKAFAVVDADGVSFQLDHLGNEKAFDLIRQEGLKKPVVSVTVTGEKQKDKVKVDSISPVR
jgi:hypothetical protein